MKKTVIIVAGGSGRRMGVGIPKQFLLLKGKPVLMHTIQRFYEYDRSIQLIVVLPESEMDHWRKLNRSHDFNMSHLVVAGGQSRIDSVRAGLSVIGDDEVVGIHDGVRPFCTRQLIATCFEEAIKKTSAIPCVPVTDSIRMIQGSSSKSVERSGLHLVQTPQCFHSGKLKAAYALPVAETFTDDASVFEAAGNKLNIVQGEKTNIKITFPSDMPLAEALAARIFSNID